MEEKEEKEAKKTDKFKGAGFVAGALSASAWFVALDSGGFFEVWDFVGKVLGVAFFGFLFFVLGMTPFVVAQKEKEVSGKVLTIAGALALNGYLIYSFCFR